MRYHRPDYIPPAAPYVPTHGSSDRADWPLWARLCLFLGVATVLGMTVAALAIALSVTWHGGAHPLPSSTPTTYGAPALTGGPRP
jgi:hypothetical protein